MEAKLNKIVENQKYIMKIIPFDGNLLYHLWTFYYTV